MGPAGMTALAATDEDAKAIGRINGALRGPATEIFQTLIPDLRARTRRDAYERIMNSPHMAATCFREFRARPELFQTLMVGPDAAPVTNDDQVLSCGRTLAQVITLVVRAVAKRYFRARLAIIRKPEGLQKTKQPGLFAVIFGAFQAPPPPPKPPRKEYFRADALYQAMRAYLLFEWQVSLIPHYASLPISLVNDLGPRILDYREVAELEALARAAKAPGSEPPAEPEAFHPSAAPDERDAPSVVSVFSLSGTPSSLPPAGPLAKIDALRSVSRRFGLATLFGFDDGAMNQLIDVVNGPGRPILSALAQAGVAAPEAIVAAACIARRVGPTRFENLMNSTYAATFLQDLINQSRERNIKSLESASEIQQGLNAILDQMLRNVPKP
jgi:hypothetical protein